MGHSDVVLLTVDSLRYDAVFSEDQTVRGGLNTVEELVNGGVHFHDAWATAPFTKGSVPAILTGCYQWRLPGAGIPTEAHYLPQAMKEAGYTTGGFHSNPHLDERFGWGRGFDKYYSGGFEGSESGIMSRLQTLIKSSKVATQAAQKVLNHIGRFSGTDIRGRPYVSADLLHSRVEEWLSNVESPIFLWIHYMDVHNPWYPEDGTVSECLSEKEIIKCYYEAKDGTASLNHRKREMLRKAYHGSVQKLDKEIGEFIPLLREHLDDPLIWFTSDHGELLGDNGVWFHPPSVAQQLLKIPMVVTSEGSGILPQSPVSTVDIAPTTLDYTTGGSPGGMDGKSLLKQNQNRTVYAESGHADGGKIRAIGAGEKNESYAIDGSKELPDRVSKEASRIISNQSGETQKVENQEDLQGQLEALGYK